MNVPSLIGVTHLPALPGAPLADGAPSQALKNAREWALREARLLAQAGFEGIILENFGDTPFFKTQVPAETIASMAAIASAVREEIRPKIAIGINVLRNDAHAALAIAATTGCQMIRVNVLTGVAATDQGLIEGDAASLLRDRRRLQAKNVAILADVHVKHARPLSSSDIGLAVEEASRRALADAVVVTGTTTGRAVDPTELRRAAHAARESRAPLLIGSGATAKNLKELLQFASGIIVGSDLRKGGKAGAALDAQRCREFARVFHKTR